MCCLICHHILVSQTIYSPLSTEQLDSKTKNETYYEYAYNEDYYNLCIYCYRQEEQTRCQFTNNYCTDYQLVIMQLIEPSQDKATSP